MPNDDTLLPALGNTQTDDTYTQLVILQNAFRCVLDCEALREADPPLLDALDALTERFHDLLMR